MSAARRGLSAACRGWKRSWRSTRSGSPAARSREGDKITAIKMLRAATGLGLEEAKNVLESAAARRPKEEGPAP